ncbi:MAG: hypothetical protein FWD63_00815 [Propionibacteriaceae bacterium]|nr:hypothetical protein [Propionibacteriaceae bacterium]
MWEVLQAAGAASPVIGADYRTPLHASALIVSAVPLQDNTHDHNTPTEAGIAYRSIQQQLKTQ